MDSASRPDQWLVRTHFGKIQGPFPAEKIKKMILSGQLKHQDEVSQANYFWVQVSEVKEIEAQLGIQVPVESDHDEDGTITETDTDTLVPENLPTDGSSVMARLAEPERVRGVLLKPAPQKISEQKKPEPANRLSLLLFILGFVVAGACLFWFKRS